MGEDKTLFTLNSFQISPSLNTLAVQFSYTQHLYLHLQWNPLAAFPQEVTPNIFFLLLEP